MKWITYTKYIKLCFTLKSMPLTQSELYADSPLLACNKLLQNKHFDIWKKISIPKCKFYVNEYGYKKQFSRSKGVPYKQVLLYFERDYNNLITTT